MAEPNYEKVVAYHQRTKHHRLRLAASADFMDWDNEPEPFRSYDGARVIRLPIQKKTPGAAHADLYVRGNNRPRDFTMGHLSGFLGLSMGLSAWKEIFGSRWALRINPSSGNLHPTESYLIVPPADPLASGVYHYHPFHHSLESRARLPEKLWRGLRRHFGTDCFFVALSSIFWRESWKYGERAFRYCNHDAGHALAALSFAASLYGWKLTCLDALADDDMDILLGFDKTAWKPMEAEHPDLMAVVYPADVNETPRGLPDDFISALAETGFSGAPNALSRRHTKWSAIDRAASVTRKPPTTGIKIDFETAGPYRGPHGALTATDIIRRRRSGVAFERQGAMKKEVFFSILDKTNPRNRCAPFDTGPAPPSAHLLLFVHSVEGLDRGLYFFFRNGSDTEQIRALSDPDFLWEPVEPGFPLFLLKRGGFRQRAALVSCDQNIAGDGVFSLGMICKFTEILKEEPWRYRHLFWETGMIGQVLYLEAEAHGFRGTGIGCFYDDEVHELLGFKGRAFQSLYHFTIGKPVEDPRLKSHPPYDHLDDGEGLKGDTR